MTYKDKLKKIFQYHGLSAQLKKLSEEVFELQEAILTGSNFADITKEFADVMVLLNQIKAIYNLDEEEIKEAMKYKIDRQLKRDGLDENI